MFQPYVSISLSIRVIHVNAVFKERRDFFKIKHKCTLWVKCDLPRFLWPKVKGQIQCDSFSLCEVHVCPTFVNTILQQHLECFFLKLKTKINLDSKIIMINSFTLLCSCLQQLVRGVHSSWIHPVIVLSWHPSINKSNGVSFLFI